MRAAWVCVILGVAMVAAACADDGGTAPEPTTTTSTTVAPTTVPTTTSTSITTVPEPVACVDSGHPSKIPAETYLDPGAEPSHIVQLDREDVSTYRVCPPEGEPWEFTAPESEDVAGSDLNRDGTDDLIFFATTGAWYFSADVYVKPIGQTTVVPLLDLAGDPIAISSTAAEVDNGSGSWHSCGDLDGDGRFGLGRGTYETVGDTIIWEGTEARIVYGEVVSEAAVSGELPDVEGDLWPTIGEPCVSAGQVRTDAATVCADIEEWPGGEPFHSGAALGDVEPRPGDILLSLLPQIEVWRVTQDIGDALYVDRDEAPAYHDGDGGLVYDTRGTYAVYHWPAGAERAVELIQPGPDDQVRLFGVENIDGVETAMVKVRSGEFNDVVGRIEMIPLDGSPRWTLPSFDYSEGGASSLRWTSDVFVMTGGGEGSAWMLGLDRDGNEVDLAWNSWREGWGDSEGLYVAAIVNRQRAWIAATEGLTTTVYERDVASGETLGSWVIPGRSTVIDITLDQLLLQSPPWGCMRLFDPRTGEITDLHHGGGVATIG